MISKFLKNLNKFVLTALFASQILAPMGAVAQISGIEAPSSFGRFGETSISPTNVERIGGEIGTFDFSAPTIPVTKAPEVFETPEESFFETIFNFFGQGGAPIAEEEVLGDYQATVTNTQEGNLNETTVEFSSGAFIDEESIQAPPGTVVIVDGNIVTIFDLPPRATIVFNIKDPGRASFSHEGVTGPVRLIKPIEDFTKAVHDARLSDGDTDELDRPGFRRNTEVVLPTFPEFMGGISGTSELLGLVERASKLNWSECEELVARFNDLLAELKRVAAGLAEEFGPLANQFGKFADAYKKVSDGLGKGEPIDWKAVDGALAAAEQFFADAAEWTQTKSQPGPLTNAVNKLANTIKDLRSADDSGYAKDAAAFGAAVDALKATLGEFGSAETRAADKALGEAMDRLMENLKKLAGTDCPLPTVVSGFPGEIIGPGGDTVVGQKEDLTGPKGDFDNLADKIKQRGGGDQSITVAIPGPGDESFEIKETVGLEGNIIFVDIKYYANEADKAAGKPIAKGFGSEKEGERTDKPDSRERLGQFGGVGYRIRVNGYWRPGSEGAIELVLNKMEKALRQKMAGFLGEVDTLERDNDALPTGAIDELKAKQKPCNFDDFKNKFGFDVGDLRNDPDTVEEFLEQFNGVQQAMLQGLFTFGSEPIDPKVAGARDALIDYLIVAITSCNFDFSLVDSFTGVTSAGAAAGFVGIAKELEELGKTLENASMVWKGGDEPEAAGVTTYELGSFDAKARSAVEAFIKMLNVPGGVTDYHGVRDRVILKRLNEGF